MAIAAGVPSLRAPLCGRALALPNLRNPAHAQQRRVRRLSDPHPDAPLERCLAAVDYAYPWDDLIARFKFRDEPGLAATLADRMLAAPGAAEAIKGSNWLVPIPLSPQRLSSRGYNQAWELVKALRSRLIHPPLGIADALVRLGTAPDQHSLPRDERLGNLRGAFAVAPRHLDALRGASVLLVDDVSTTGATLQNAALALKQGGVARVQGLVIARTLSG
jgi:ComF family protein